MRLQVAADAPLADWFVRLEDVAADGSVTAITGSGINGAQRRSEEHPEPLVPGTEYTLELDLYFSSWVWIARPSHSRGGLERSVAHALAHALHDDDDAACGRKC